MVPGRHPYIMFQKGNLAQNYFPNLTSHFIMLFTKCIKIGIDILQTKVRAADMTSTTIRTVSKSTSQDGQKTECREKQHELLSFYFDLYISNFNFMYIHILIIVVESWFTSYLKACSISLLSRDIFQALQKVAAAFPKS